MKYFVLKNIETPLKGDLKAAVCRALRTAPDGIADLILLSSMNMHPPAAQKTMILGMAMAIIAFFAGEIGTKLL